MGLKPLGKYPRPVDFYDEPTDFVPCPVCLYDKVHAPLKWSICPCCRTQFGLSDSGPEAPEYYHKELQREWVSEGGPWWSSRKPLGWTPDKQLEEIRKLRGEE